MKNLALDISKMIEILPPDDQKLAYMLIKKLVIAWDPNFTKVTPDEAERIKAAEHSGFISESDINWDEIGV